MGLVDRDDGWHIPDWLWAKIEPLAPPSGRPLAPLGLSQPTSAGFQRHECHSACAAYRHAMECS